MFALRIDFLECETFFLGTAKRNGGMSSSNDSHAALKDQPSCAGAKGVAGRKAAANCGRANGSLSAGSSVRVIGGARAAMVVNKDEPISVSHFRELHRAL